MLNIKEISKLKCDIRILQDSIRALNKRITMLERSKGIITVGDKDFEGILSLRKEATDEDIYKFNVLVENKDINMFDIVTICTVLKLAE